MHKLFAYLSTFLFCATGWGQNSFKAFIIDEHHHHPLVGANVLVKGTNLGASSDQTGFVEIFGIPDGDQIIVVSYIGFEEHAHRYTFPLSQDQPVEIALHGGAEHMEEVYVSATRSSRTIADIPTRVEAISGEELNEKGNMKPGDIRMLLNESTGIQTQQTSATSYNSSIRIQGLDGKYTQILKDGLPLYSGFSGGLSLLQIVPLDLEQVEVIKGASSTLHGGGAIAGLVNLVSKSPTSERQLNFLLNGTSAKGLDASVFYAFQSGFIGSTVFASYNSGAAYDPANNGLTAIPEFTRYTINPKLFISTSEHTQFKIGFNATMEDRLGGDMKYIDGEADSIHTYYEENKTSRVSTLFGMDHQRTEASSISIKNSFSYYDRSVAIPDHQFSGVQQASFSEASYSHVSDKFEWVAGLNLWSDRFTQDVLDSTAVVDYSHLTYGGFVQSTWSTTEQLSLETGLRLDHQTDYGNFILPRLALMFKVNPKMVIRFGGGLGYKTPNIFTEDAEKLQFRNVLPLDVEKTKAEESLGTNIDINFRTPLFTDLTLSINSLLFYTQIDDPILLAATSSGIWEFHQPDGEIDTRGVETNVKLAYDHFKLFVGHTFADVNQRYNNEANQLTLVSRHRLNNVLMYEKHDDIRVGLEAYYFGPQELNDGSRSSDYWIFGLMTEKMWEGFSLFLNFENFLDTRQSKFEAIYTGSISNPQFTDIYAPVDGFVINGGFKLNL